MPLNKLRSAVAIIIKSFGIKVYTAKILKDGLLYEKGSGFKAAISRPERGDAFNSPLGLQDTNYKYKMYTHYNVLRENDLVVAGRNAYQIESIEDNYDRNLDYVVLYVRKVFSDIKFADRNPK